ncbi:hypothetical protein QUA81_28800 [Microcoleus sp. F6_B4]
MKKLTIAAILAISTPLVIPEAALLAQSASPATNIPVPQYPGKVAPPPPPGDIPLRRVPSSVAPPSPGGSRDYRLVEKAARDIAKARRDAYEMASISGRVSSSEASEFVSTAGRILSDAESAYSGGRYFSASEKAKAASALYAAANTLDRTQLAYAVDRRGPKKPGRGNYVEAPDKARERIARAEAELTYYRSTDATASQLIDRAKNMVGGATPVSTSGDVSYLGRNRAAEHAAKAAMHLIAAQRGF